MSDRDTRTPTDQLPPTMSIDGLVKSHWYRITWRFKYGDVEMGPMRFHRLWRWREHRKLLVLGYYEDGSKFKFPANGIIKIEEVAPPKSADSESQGEK